ncbi:MULTISPECIES: DUF924 family protein [Trichocoleus]|uniref:DUF924 domain-containing protein n=1 Tax=Trichocoleus desertorum GB2-A4 TaxID=2933944 RepID=A0ABV0JFK7_9CYAN|nr:DUF924 family protein [Trichocoleus sp. FACHB-46]MBD1864876.1 DUF924 domain-containing protein [Trichocoleus sp. FACHB-46]
MATEKYEDVLRFWFPVQPKTDQPAMVRQWEWWFRGGGNAEIIEHFSPLLEQAIRGELDAWSRQPQSRLALILVLDQFSRSIYQDTALAFAQDSKACMLTLEGINAGHYASLKTPWERTFFFLPLGHSENLTNLELAIELADDLVQESPQEYRALLEFSAAQARRHRDILTRFGRHPHRNKALGRQSTPEELEYLASGQLVHTRSMPSHLSQSLSETRAN